VKHTLFPVIVLAALALPVAAQVETLPAPVVHSNSIEIISNSRYSSHSGYSSALSDTLLANVLWAMGRVPSFGSSFREFYVATPSNVYLYDPGAHTLAVHLSGNHRYSSNSAFEIGVAVERQEEAGLSIQAGLLAGDAFWSRGSGTVTSCPMAFAANYANSNWSPNHTILMVNVYGRMSVTGLTDSCQARSSDSTLPRPTTNGADTFEVVMADLTQDSLFDPATLPLSAASQLLWAGYGVTPHRPVSKQGLTIPSAVANYYLTQHVYLVGDTAVMRYHNRLPPGTNMSTSDHRLQLVTSGDRRDSLRRASARIPATAPLYIVVCYTDTTTAWALIEAGFVGFQYLAQARAMGLTGCLTAPLSPTERTAVRNALGLPGTEYPLIVFSVGQELTAVEERPALAGLRLTVRPSPGLPVRLEYVIPEVALVEFTIRDLAGRTVRNWTEQATSPGQHMTAWNGLDNHDQAVPAGVYLCAMKAGDATARARLILPR
jgi:FlgD Ig-like domain/Nitroreductase family